VSLTKAPSLHKNFYGFFLPLQPAICLYNICKFIAGIAYSVTDQIDLTTDFRYIRIDDIDLTSENSTGTINDIDYDPASLVVGLSYKF